MIYHVMGWPAWHSNHCHCPCDDVSTSSSIIPKHKLKFPFVQKQILNWSDVSISSLLDAVLRSVFLSLSIAHISVYSLVITSLKSLPGDTTDLLAGF
jgi:hypothetical protein